MKGKGLRKGLGKKGEMVYFKKGQVGFWVVFEENRLKKGQEVCILLFVRKTRVQTWEGFLCEKIYKLVITPKCDKEAAGEEIMKKILQINNWESFICE